MLGTILANKLKMFYLILIVPQPEAPVINALWLVAPDHQLRHGDGGRDPNDQTHSAALEKASFILSLIILNISSFSNSHRRHRSEGGCQ